MVKDKDKGWLRILLEWLVYFFYVVWNPFVGFIHRYYDATNPTFTTKLLIVLLDAFGIAWFVVWALGIFVQPLLVMSCVWFVGIPLIGWLANLYFNRDINI